MIFREGGRESRSPGLAFAAKGGGGEPWGCRIVLPADQPLPGFRFTDHPDLAEARSIFSPFLYSNENDPLIIPLFNE